jgi:hypothetical protein
MQQQQHYHPSHNQDQSHPWFQMQQPAPPHNNIVAASTAASTYVPYGYAQPTYPSSNGYHPQTFLMYNDLIRQLQLHQQPYMQPHTHQFASTASVAHLTSNGSAKPFAAVVAAAATAVAGSSRQATQRHHVHRDQKAHI